MFKVAHLTSAHSRYDSRIFYKECKSLVKHGHKVSLVVADGKGDETRDGISIHDVGAPSGRLDRMLNATIRIFRRAKILDADIYHLHDPELLPIGRRLKLIGKKIVFDAHENYVAQIRERKYLPKLFRNAISRLFDFYEKQTITQFHAIVVVADHQLERYTSLNSNVSLVPNFADIEFFSQRELDYSQIRILHAGSLSENRGLFAMINLAKRLGSCGEIHLAGPLEDGVKVDDIKSAKYLGVLAQDQLAAHYNRSNVGLILYQPCGQYGMATAIKLYEYMAAGVPVIVPNHGEWPELVRRLGVGVAVDVSDVDAQLETILWFKHNPREANQMGKRGRAYVEKFASWSSSESALLKMYKKLQQTDGNST